MNINHVLIGGRLTRDPELKHVGEDKTLCTFGMAINRRRKDRDDDVTFVDCEAWDRTAEIMAERLRKGSAVFIEGRLRFSQWEQDGQNRSNLSVVVERFEFVGDRDESAARSPATRASAPAAGHDEKDIAF